MNKELMGALDELERDKNISKETLLDAIEVVPAALVDAAGHFPQTVDRSLLTEGEPPTGAIDRKSVV